MPLARRSHVRSRSNLVQSIHPRSNCNSCFCKNEFTAYLPLLDNNISIADNKQWYTVTGHPLKDVEVTGLVVGLRGDGTGLVWVPDHNVSIRTNRNLTLQKHITNKNFNNLCYRLFDVYVYKNLLTHIR